MRGRMVAGTASGVGKTTVALAVMAGMRRRGLKVRPSKCGPDFLAEELEGFTRGNVPASSVHLHFRSNPVMAESFVDAIARVRGLRAVTA